MKPRALDLFCGAGGATRGLQLAGFHVTGVDIRPQPRYVGDAFYQADAMEFPLEGYDFIWASPPCQAYSLAGQQWRKSGKEYPDLVAATRDKLNASGIPWVIENVPGAPLVNPIALNGAMFGMRLRRVRIFEASFPLGFYLLPDDAPMVFRMGRRPKPHEAIVPVGHFSDVPRARREMRIDWMGQKELSQAIPPAYAEFIGRQAMEYLTAERPAPSGEGENDDGQNAA